MQFESINWRTEINVWEDSTLGCFLVHEISLEKEKERASAVPIGYCFRWSLPLMETCPMLPNKNKNKKHTHTQRKSFRLYLSFLFTVYTLLVCPAIRLELHLCAPCSAISFLSCGSVSSFLPFHLLPYYLLCLFFFCCQNVSLQVNWLRSLGEKLAVEEKSPVFFLPAVLLCFCVKRRSSALVARALKLITLERLNPTLWEKTKSLEEWMTVSFSPFWGVQSPSTTNPRVRINQCSKSVTNRIIEKTVPVFVLSGYSKLGENFIITRGEEGV